MTTYYNIPDSAWLFRYQIGRRRTEDAKWTPAEESVRQWCLQVEDDSRMMKREGGGGAPPPEPHQCHALGCLLEMVAEYGIANAAAASLVEGTKG